MSKRNIEEVLMGLMERLNLKRLNLERTSLHTLEGEYKNNKIHFEIYPTSIIFTSRRYSRKIVRTVSEVLNKKPSLRYTEDLAIRQGYVRFEWDDKPLMRYKVLNKKRKKGLVLLNGSP